MSIKYVKAFLVRTGLYFKQYFNLLILNRDLDWFTLLRQFMIPPVTNYLFKNLITGCRLYCRLTNKVIQTTYFSNELIWPFRAKNTTTLHSLFCTRYISVDYGTYFADLRYVKQWILRESLAPLSYELLCRSKS